MQSSGKNSLMVEPDISSYDKNDDSVIRVAGISYEEMLDRMNQCYTLGKVSRTPFGSVLYPRGVLYPNQATNPNLKPVAVFARNTIDQNSVDSIYSLEHKLTRCQLSPIAHMAQVGGDSTCGSILICPFLGSPSSIEFLHHSGVRAIVYDESFMHFILEKRPQLRDLYSSSIAYLSSLKYSITIHPIRVLDQDIDSEIQDQILCLI